MTRPRHCRSRPDDSRPPRPRERATSASVSGAGFKGYFVELASFIALDEGLRLLLTPGTLGGVSGSSFFGAAYMCSKWLRDALRASGNDWNNGDDAAEKERLAQPYVEKFYGALLPKGEDTPGERMLVGAIFDAALAALGPENSDLQEEIRFLRELLRLTLVSSPLPSLELSIGYSALAAILRVWGDEACLPLQTRFSFVSGAALRINEGRPRRKVISPTGDALLLKSPGLQYSGEVADPKLPKSTVDSPCLFSFKRDPQSTTFATLTKASSTRTSTTSRARTRQFFIQHVAQGPDDCLPGVLLQAQPWPNPAKPPPTARLDSAEAFEVAILSSFASGNQIGLQLFSGTLLPRLLALGCVSPPIRDFVYFILRETQSPVFARMDLSRWKSHYANFVTRFQAFSADPQDLPAYTVDGTVTDVTGGAAAIDDVPACRDPAQFLINFFNPEGELAYDQMPWETLFYLPGAPLDVSGRNRTRVFLNFQDDDTQWLKLVRSRIANPFSSDRNLIEREYPQSGPPRITPVTGIRKYPTIFGRGANSCASLDMWMLPNHIEIDEETGTAKPESLLRLALLRFEGLPMLNTSKAQAGQRGYLLAMPLCFNFSRADDAYGTFSRTPVATYKQVTTNYLHVLATNPAVRALLLDEMARLAAS